MDIFGNIVFLGGKLLILLFLIFIWIELFKSGDYVTWILLTLACAAGGYVGYRQAVAEGA